MSEYTRKPRSTRRNRAPRILLVLCLMLVVIVGSIAGTVAWLTATSENVTNTFTVGDINIELAETTGTSYKIIPGATVSKDPKVTVKSGSEKCYVYVKVENNLLLNNTVVVTPNINTKNWTDVETKSNTTLYRYVSVIDAGSADVSQEVFTSVKADDTITKSDITTLKDKTIVLTAYAHQSENTTQEVADAAAKAWAFPTSTVTD